MENLSTEYFKEYELKDNLEDGSFSGWSSYPMVQDYGYNPDLSPKKEFKNDKENYVLWSQKRLLDSEIIRVGFIKKVDFWINNDSKVRFQYRLKSYEPVDMIKICFVTEDSKYIKKIKQNPRKDSWQDFYFDMEDILKESKPLRVISMFIEAETVGKYIDEAYELKIDDVYIKALRPYEPVINGFEYGEHPQYIEAYITKSYREEDCLDFEIDVPEDIKGSVSKIALDLTSPEGKSLFSDKSDYKGKAVRKKISVFKKGEPGLWKLKIDCNDDSDKKIITKSYEILVISEEIKSKKSPFLYFDEEDKESLKKKLEEKEISDAYEYVRRCAEEERVKIFAKEEAEIEKIDDNYFLFGSGRYFELIEPVSKMIQKNALVYYLDNDEEAFEAVKKAVLTMSSWKQFNHPWIKKHGQYIYYPTGEVSQKLAFGYDVIASRLSAEERKRIAEFFISSIIIPAYNEYYFNDRIPAKSSNWEAHVLSGAILCGISIINNAQEEKFIEYLIPLIQTLKRFLKEYLLEDNSSAESTGYLSMAFNSLSSVIPALKRILKIDLNEEFKIDKSVKYLTYLSGLKDSYMDIDYGDSGPLSNWSNLAYYAKNTKNNLIKYLYNKYRGKEISDVIWGNLNKDEAKVEGLPLQSIFPEKGAFVYRSDWSSDCLFFSIKCGPYFNHGHADNGSFYIYFKNNLIIDESGTSPGGKHYYDDPYFNSYYTQCIGHNTLIVDDNTTSQKFAEWPTKSLGLKNYPRFNKNLLSGELNFLSCDLSSVYDDLENYERYVLHIKPDIFLIIDKFKHIDDKEKNYSQIFHTGELTKSFIEDGIAKIIGSNSKLFLESLSPENVVVEKKLGHIPLRRMGGNYGEKSEINDLKERFYFSFKTGDKKISDILITGIQVFGDGQDRYYKPWGKEYGEEFIEIKKEDKDKNIKIYISKSGINRSDIKSDAEIVGIIEENNKKSEIKLFLNNGTYIDCEGVRLIESKINFCSLIDFNKEYTKLNLFLKEFTELKAYFPRSPEKIEVNKKILPDNKYKWDSERKQISLKLSKGSNEVAIS